MKKRKFIIISLCFNAALFVLGLIGVILNMNKHGFPVTFEYYTQDSNIFLFLSTIPMLIYEIKALVKKSFILPRWVLLFKYYATTCVGVTFVIVLTILAPHPLSGGYGVMMFANSMLFQHTICPVLAIIVFLFFEKDFLCTDSGEIHTLKFRHTFWALVPSVVYALFLYPLNIADIVYGPYPFLLVNELGPLKAVLWFILVVALIYVIGLLLWLGNRKIKVHTD